MKILSIIKGGREFTYYFCAFNKNVEKQLNEAFILLK